MELPQQLSPQQSPVNPTKLERTVRVFCLGCLVASSTHQPHLTPKMEVSLVGCVNPLSLWNSRYPASPTLCRSPGSAPFFKRLAPVPRLCLPSYWRPSKSTQNLSQYLRPPCINQSPGNLPCTPLRHSPLYLHSKLSHCLELLCFQYELFRHSSFWPQSPILLGYLFSYPQCNNLLLSLLHSPVLPNSMVQHSNHLLTNGLKFLCSFISIAWQVSNSGWSLSTHFFHSYT